MTRSEFQVTRQSRCETMTVRGVRYNIRKWGHESGRPILFLHGTQDSSITFQFVVENLAREWFVVAPDWRGHGQSEWTSQGYWFHEFVADLDVLVSELFGSQSIPIVGHSLGGNIASILAGLRPDRPSHLISLDGFGPLVSLVPVDIRKLLGELLSIPGKNRKHKLYASVELMADRLIAANPRLTPERARFLARNLSRANTGGQRKWLFDPSHKMSLPSLRTMEEWGQVWSAITAPVLWIASNDRRPFAPVNVAGELDRRAELMPGVQRMTIPGTGHNLHHDEPGRVAEAIELFLSETAVTSTK